MRSITAVSLVRILGGKNSRNEDIVEIKIEWRMVVMEIISLKPEQANIK